MGQLLCPHWKEWTYSDFSVTIDAERGKSAARKIIQKILYRLEKNAILVPIYYGGNLLHEVMNMEKSNPYTFYVVLADGIMEIPQDSNLSWITLFYALPKELVEKRPAYLELPRNIHQLLHSEEYRKEIYEQRTIGNHARCDGCQAASTACLTFCGVTSPAVSDCSVFRYCTAARPRSFIVFPLSSR